MRYPNLLTGLLPTIFSSYASATCQNYLFPSSGAVCNVPPGSTAYLKTLIVLSETNAGDCDSVLALTGGQIAQQENVIFTGVDGIVSTVAALNTVSAASPTLTGTFTFTYPVPYASIQTGSPVTQIVNYSVPLHNDYTSSTRVFTLNAPPTIRAAVSTRTSFTVTQVFASTTSTLTTTAVSTLAVLKGPTTTVTGVQTVTAKTPTITKQVTLTSGTFTRFTSCQTSRSTTISCYTSKTANRLLGKRQAALGAEYDLPYCAAPYTNTVFTSIHTIFTGRTYTLYNTNFKTITTTSYSVPSQATFYTNITKTVTTTPKAVTHTSFHSLSRPTHAYTYTQTNLNVFLPFGSGTPFCGRYRPQNVVVPADAPALPVPQ